jgi:pimeloyl-ACP methyl ester carboxylesterase
MTIPVEAPPYVEKRRTRHWGKPAIAALLLAVVALLIFAGFRPVGTMRAATRLSLWFVGFRSEYAQIGPYRIHYFVGGEGPPILLVHGLGSRADDWALTMKDLRRHYRVYAIDLLGHGHSDWPQIDYAIQRQTDMVREFLVSQKIVPADVVGISMGGWVALQLASEHPEMVRRLVLIDSAGLHFETTLTVDSFSPTTPAELETFHELLTPKAQPIPSFMARDLLRLLGGHSWVAHRILSTMMTRQDELDGKLQAVTMPVLIIWGKEDRITPLSEAENMKRAMPQASMVVVPGCGHIAVLDCWDSVRPALTSFLQGEAPPPSTPATSEGK